MFGNITVKSRSLRLAFLIPPDKSALLKAIEVNSTLWGGFFNPIIPLFQQAPKAWKEYPGQKISMRNRMLGYVRAFDPDVLVNCTNGELPSYLNGGRRLSIRIDEIWSDFHSDERNGTPKYGVGIFELLNGIFKEFFEIKRRFPTKVLLPTYSDHELFWAATVGQLPDAHRTVIESNYSGAIDIEKPKLGPANYDPILASNSFFPRRITHYRLKSEKDGRTWKDTYAFYMDASKFADIVDFWNLRALGRTVLPIPKQFAASPDYLQFIRNFVRETYRVNVHNPAITYGTTIVRSFSSQMSELEELAKSLDPQTIIPNKRDAHPLAIQHWYPRIWDEWAMGKDSAAPDNIVSEVSEFSFPDTKDVVSFDLVKPDFAHDAYGSSPRFANEIYPKFYGEGKNILADVLPYDHGEEVIRVAGGTYAFEDDFRIGRTGLIHLVKWKQKSRWKIPHAEKIFFAWLKDKGFDPSLSTCGRLAKEIYSQLEGWINVLALEPLLALLDKMNKGGAEGKGTPLGEVKNSLRTMNPVGNLYQSLVNRGVFQLGYKTQCTHCERASWHSLEEFSKGLVCPLCHKHLEPISAVDTDSQGAWHLKTAGPFSIGNYGDGSYCVLLGLNFFERDHSLQMTPVLSFRAKHRTSGRELEADFGIMWQETVYGETEDGILFAECKSYNRFEKKDFERMRNLAGQFPGAILAFCTLP
jgi:hypothetical protein